MIEYQILVRLNKTRITKGRDKELYGNCQVCNDICGQYCIEASRYPVCKIHCVFLFCKDCHAVLNEICSVFIYKKNVYTYEDSYHISESPIRQKYKWYCNTYYIDPIWRTK
jgi:hypothetical protein